MTAAAPQKNHLQVVSFRLAGDEYALDITAVKEVIQAAGITPVPGLPRWIRGVINLRGTVIPVVDLRAQFGLTAPPEDDLTRILITRHRDRLVGFVVDAVSQVLKVPRSDVQPAPAAIAQIAGRYLAGIARIAPGRLAILIDIEAVLDPSAIAGLPIPAAA
jgi:purine-binding chemotaxis protein CheW